MIRYTYSDHNPQIQRLQGCILYPHGIEQVKFEGENGPETQYRFKLLKFVDNGEDITDYEAFTASFKDQIDAQLSDDIDVQQRTAKRRDWHKLKSAENVLAHVRLGQGLPEQVPVRKMGGK